VDELVGCWAGCSGCAPGERDATAERGFGDGERVQLVGSGVGDRSGYHGDAEAVGG
jgi:hypothetical protein